MLLTLFLAVQFLTLSAQDDSTCPALVARALTAISSNCDSLDRNSACYGYRQVDATFADTALETSFDAPADRVGLADLNRLDTAPLDADNDLWGAAVLNLQANLPNTLPGQGVRFVLLGDTGLENDVLADDALQLAEPITIRPIQAVNLRAEPRLDSGVVSSVAAGIELSADGLSPDRRWLRVLAGRRSAWVSRPLVDAPETVNDLPVISADDRTSMQAFYLTTSLSGQTCNAAPPSIMVIQSSKEIIVDLEINGANINIGSTIALRQTSNTEIQLYVIDGRALLDNGVIIPGGYTVYGVLTPDANGRLVITSWYGSRPFNGDDISLLTPLESIPVDVIYYPIVIGGASFVSLPPVGGGQGVAVTGGDCGAFRPTSPMEGLAQGNTTFYWDAAPGANGYRLNIYSVDFGRGALVKTFEMGNQTNYTTNTSVDAIGQGYIFAYEVLALFNGQVICGAAPFEILREAGSSSIVPTVSPFCAIVVLAGSPYTGPYDILVAGDNYNGLPCDELIHGNGNNNIIFGAGGNDTIYGYGGIDTLNGDDGNDTIFGGAGNDFVYGGTGSDNVDGGAGADDVFGGWDNLTTCVIRDDVGNDHVRDTGGDNGDQVQGGNQNFNCGGGDDIGNDLVEDTGGDADIVYGGNGNGNGPVGNDIGNDTVIDGGGDGDSIYGGNGNGNGSAGSDGSDTVTAFGNNDLIAGGNNNNLAAGINDDNTDGGFDTVTANDGDNNDQVFGGNWIGPGADSGADVCNFDGGDAVAGCP